MTGKVKVGLNGTDNIDRVCAKSLALHFSEAKPANISDMFLGTVKKYIADHSSSTIYNNHHLIIAATSSKSFLSISSPIPALNPFRI